MQSIIEANGFNPSLDADNGNRFLVGNGYMGVRGTISEAGPDQMAAVNLAGIHHQKGSAWEEPLNAPNPLFFQLKGYALPDAAEAVESHRLALNIASGLFSRETVFHLPEGGTLTLQQRRFCAMDDVHLLAQRITLTATCDVAVEATFGIDPYVWDINGPHFGPLETRLADGVVSALGTTDDGKAVCTALRLPTDDAAQADGLVTRTLTLRAYQPLVLDFAAAVFTSNDTHAVEAKARRAAAEAPGYDVLFTRQQAAWAKLWDAAQVEIEGDPQAEFAVNYSLYHLMSIAPRHVPSLSVPARGLSGQTYKGAIFWDTEMFMLDFYLAALPQVARACLQYRIDSLPGALDKARHYGLDGAFYAWESVEGGKDACSDYNVTDVFTGRPMRTFFRDKQVHISADVVYGLKKYLEHTGDDSLMAAGGAQVVLECARFYLSLITRRLTREEYDLNDVIGPDEYHERVNNNAYTNELARLTLQWAAEICPKYLQVEEKELAAFRDAAAHLKRQAPDPKTGLIEQFDGYFQLEDVSVDTVRSRLLDPKEYWGGAYGVASHTQVIKQADVIALLYMLGGYPREVVAANYDYYEPRTEHGSSLSACMYALCACMIGRPQAAYPLFLKSAEADIRGGGKQWAGLVYIGGTHPAAAGGAYMVLMNGFLGLTWENGQPVLHPCLPDGWTRVKAKVQYQGKTFVVETGE